MAKDTTVTENIDLAVNGSALDPVFKNVNEQLNKIARKLVEINGITAKSGDGVSKKLDLEIKKLSRALQQIKTLENLLGEQSRQGSRPVSTAVQEQALGRRALAAAKYEQNLRNATTALEALEARQNRLVSRSAKLASEGIIPNKSFTQTQRNIDGAIKDLKRLEREFDILNRKAAAAGGDYSPQRRAFQTTLGQLRAAATDGRRTNFGEELKQASGALDAYKAAVADASTSTAQLLNIRKRAAADEVRSLTSVNGLERARLQNQLELRRLNDAIATGETRNLRILVEQLAVERAKERAIERQLKAVNAQNAQARSGVLPSGGLNTVFARTAAYAGAGTALFGAVSTAQEGLRFVVEFEDELAKLAAIADATPAQMRDLSQSIIEIGSSSRFSLTELTRISQGLAQAGVSASEMAEALNAVTTLANASGSSPEESMQLITSAVGAFQLQMSEAPRVADLMTEALNRTKLTVAQTAQALQYVGSTAFESNISLEELLATIGAIAQAGVRSGSTIGTGFRQFLVDLQEPSKKLTDQLTALGLTEADVDVSTRGLAAVLETLRDAGFGSSQAYESLEVRAAAFYLTAKNNIDIIDQLELSFQSQGAAARANERAMNSLSAQWQRFVDIISGDFAEGMDSKLKLLTSGLRGVSDFILEIQKQSDAMEQRVSAGYGAYFERRGIAGLGDLATDQFYTQASNLSTIQTPGGLLFKGYEDYIKKTEEAAGRQGALADKIKRTDERLTAQRGTLSEATREYQRLLVQKDSLINNDVRSQAEMTNLMSRFQGLSEHLTNTKNLYNNLTGAVRSYITASQGALVSDLAAQQADQALKAKGLRDTSGKLVGDIMSNKKYDFTALPKPVQDAIVSLKAYGAGTPEFTKATAVIADAAVKLAGEKSGVGAALNALAQNMAERQTVNGQRTILFSERRQLEGMNTPQGQQIFTSLQNAQSLLSKAGAGGDGKSGLLAQVDKELANTAKLISSVVNPTGSIRAYLPSASSELQSLRNQVKATRSSSGDSRGSAEISTFGRPIEGGRVSSGYGPRSRPTKGASTNHLGVDYAAPIGTPVLAAMDGIVKFAKVVEGYGNQIELNHGAGTASRYSHLNGFNVREGQLVKKGDTIGYVGQTGVSTGPHLHYEVLRNGKKVNPNEKNLPTDSTRFTEQASRVAEAERFAIELAEAETSLAKRELRERLKDIGKATTEEALESSVSAAKAALDAVNTNLKKAAEEELGSKNLSPDSAQYRAKMAQVSDEIAQNTEEFYGRVADALVKGLKRIIDGARLDYDRALAPGQRALAVAEAQAGGLSRASLSGRVPDYVQGLADRRADRARESLTRIEAQEINGLITKQQSAISLGIGKRDDLAVTAGLESQAWATANEEVREMTKALAELESQKAVLDASLSADDQLPTKLADGLRMAIQNYREANVLNRTFSEEITYNLGGSLTAVHDSFNGFFTDLTSGTQSVGSAFQNMALSILKSLQQIVAQFAANQIFSLLLGLVAPVAGGKVLGTTGAFAGTKAYGGGYIASLAGYAGGGHVTNGSRGHDSVVAKLRRDEFVLQPRAVDSLGLDMLNAMNKSGADALRGLAGNTIIAPSQAAPPVNVYVVSEQHKQQMGPRDVLAVITDDLLRGGATKRLVRAISAGA